jgi:hypothetical protein
MYLKFVYRCGDWLRMIERLLSRELEIMEREAATETEENNESIFRRSNTRIWTDN